MVQLYEVKVSLKYHDVGYFRWSYAINLSLLYIVPAAIQYVLHLTNFFHWHALILVTFTNNLSSEWCGQRCQDLWSIKGVHITMAQLKTAQQKIMFISQTMFTYPILRLISDSLAKTHKVQPVFIITWQECNYQ